MEEERPGWPSGRMTVWAGLLAICVMSGVAGLVYLTGTTVGFPRVVAMPVGWLLGYFASRAVLRAIWQRQAEQAA